MIKTLNNQNRNRKFVWIGNISKIDHKRFPMEEKGIKI